MLELHKAESSPPHQVDEFNDYGRALIRHDAAVCDRCADSAETYPKRTRRNCQSHHIELTI